MGIFIPWYGTFHGFIKSKWNIVGCIVMHYSDNCILKYSMDAHPQAQAVYDLPMSSRLLYSTF